MAEIEEEVIPEVPEAPVPPEPIEEPVEEAPTDDTSQVAPPEEEEQENFFIPIGAEPDTLIAADLTFGEVAESLGLDPEDPASVREARSIMGTEALPEMTSQEYMFYNTYIDLWEEEPPEGYIQAAMSEGINLKEFEKREKMKPGWEDTPAYEAENEKNTAALEDLMENGLDDEEVTNADAGGSLPEEGQEA